uniref:Uncharacterized protein n=1 Tax=Sphaerodactylus townsendi TaxID=933632 RepID=A0ACB8E9V8_9SAUR
MQAAHDWRELSDIADEGPAVQRIHKFMRQYNETYANVTELEAMAAVKDILDKIVELREQNVITQYTIAEELELELGVRNTYRDVLESESSEGAECEETGRGDGIYRRVSPESPSVRVSLSSCCLSPAAFSASVRSDLDSSDDRVFDADIRLARRYQGLVAGAPAAPPVWISRTDEVPGRGDESSKAAASGARLRIARPASPIIDLGALAALFTLPALVAWVARRTAAAWSAVAVLLSGTGPSWWWRHRGSVAETPPTFLAGTRILPRLNGGPRNSGELATTFAPEPVTRDIQPASPKIDLEAVAASFALVAAC